ncbi:MAG: hypothetical protein R3E66_10535 [bacterium]
MVRPVVAFAFLSFIALSGCSSAPTKEASIEAIQTPDRLASIPADTFFLLASLEPLPAGPILDTLSRNESDLLDLTDFLVDAFGSSPIGASKLFAAMMREFDGSWNREGFEALGLSTSPHLAFYAVSWFPVFRIETNDPERVRALIQRAETRSGVILTTATEGDQTYNVYGSPGAIVTWKFEGNDLVIGAALNEAVDLWLPYFLGEQKPDVSIANSQSLTVLTQKYGFSGQLLGFLDFERMVTLVLAPTGLDAEIAQRVDFLKDDESADCKAELTSMFANYPRVVFALNSWTETEFTLDAGLEMENGLGARLADTQGPIPGTGSRYAQDPRLAAGLGVEVGKLVGLIAEMSTDHLKTPYRCDLLLPYNAGAEKFARSAALLPPLFGDIQGVALYVVKPTDTGLQPPDAGDADTERSDINHAIIVRTRDTGNIITLLENADPGFAKLEMKTDGVAVALPGLKLAEHTGYFAAASKQQFVIMTDERGAEAATELARSEPTKSGWANLSLDPADMIEAMPQSWLRSLLRIFVGRLHVEAAPNTYGMFARWVQEFPK